VLIRSFLRHLRKQGRNLRYVLIVGTGESAMELARKTRARPELGLALRGFVAAAAPAPPEIEGMPVLGTVAGLPGLAALGAAELVYLAVARAEYAAEQEALERLSDSTVAVRLVPDLARAFTLNAGVEDFDGTPVVLVTESPAQSWNMVLKRAFDLAFSAVGLLLLGPVLLIIALWVKLGSPGPALYAQERVGLNGRRFRMLKF